MQNDWSVKQIANFIARKISDKLHSIFYDNKEEYIKYWDDIHVLIKYDCIRDSKFFDRMKDAILFKTVDGDYLTINEYLEKSKDKEKKIIYYTDNKAQQSANIEMYKNNGLCVVGFLHPIDSRFAQDFEVKEQGLKFVCVTAEPPDNLTSGQVVSEDEIKALTEIFKDALGNDKLEVKAEYLKDEKTPALLSLSEHAKRYQEMGRNFGGMSFGPSLGEGYVMMINRSNSLIDKILSARYEDDKEDIVKELCQQIYDIALMSHRELKEDEKQCFIERNYKLFDGVI